VTAATDADAEEAMLVDRILRGGAQKPSLLPHTLTSPSVTRHPVAISRGGFTNYLLKPVVHKHFVDSVLLYFAITLTSDNQIVKAVAIAAIRIDRPHANFRKYIQFASKILHIQAIFRVQSMPVFSHLP
jgi:hypothetical protein